METNWYSGKIYSSIEFWSSEHVFIPCYGKEKSGHFLLILGFWLDNG